MAKKTRKIVWVVMHYEIMFGDHIDCLQFHVSSSRKAAERYIRRSSVMPYSWWQLHPHAIDHDPQREGWEGEEVYYYSHTGQLLKKAPDQKALQAFRRSQH